MDISFSHLITDTLTLVDETTVTFVQEAYRNLSQYINGLITVVATFYIMWFGYQVIYQKITLDIMTIARYITLLTIIIMLTTNWNFYYQFVYEVFTNEPMAITKALSGGKSSATDGLNQIWLDGSTAATDLWSRTDWKNYQFFFYGLAIYIATFMNCLYALGILVYAKMALAVILGLGQLFILMMLFQSTRELTTGWMRGLLYFALAFINGFLLKQVLTIASMLSNSVSLEALGNAVNLARNGIQKSWGVTKWTASKFDRNPNSRRNRNK